MNKHEIINRIKNLTDEQFKLLLSLIEKEEKCSPLFHLKTAIEK